MRKFILIEVIEREISTPDFFDTQIEAYEEMEARYNECKKGDGEIYSSVAWCENRNHDNCDWKILAVDI